jgi:hypothetical protein
MIYTDSISAIRTSKVTQRVLQRGEQYTERLVLTTDTSG